MERSSRMLTSPSSWGFCARGVGGGVGFGAQVRSRRGVVQCGTTQHSTAQRSDRSPPARSWCAGGRGRCPARRSASAGAPGAPRAARRVVGEGVGGVGGREGGAAESLHALAWRPAGSAAPAGTQSGWPRYSASDALRAPHHVGGSLDGRSPWWPGRAGPQPEPAPLAQRGPAGLAAALWRQRRRQRWAPAMMGPRWTAGSGER